MAVASRGSALRDVDLPDDVAALKQLVLTEAARARACESGLERLCERLSLLRAKRFGQRSSAAARCCSCKAPSTALTSAFCSNSFSPNG